LRIVQPAIERFKPLDGTLVPFLPALIQVGLQVIVAELLVAALV